MATGGVRILAVGVAFGLAACDAGPSVEIHNNSGASVILHLPQAGRYARPLDVQLGQGKSRAFRGDALDPDGRYRVTAGPCDYVYTYPRMGGMNYAWFVPDGKGGGAPDYRYPYPLSIQLEPDFRLHLLAPGGLNQCVGRPDPATAHGFPMTPISKSCR
jgi:hypothetical protein